MDLVMAMGTARILVVDDEKDYLRLMERILGRSGYEVFSALDALKGLEKLRKHNPHLVILDIMLPDMSGWEACREIKKDGGAKVLILTVPMGNDFQEKIAYSGCDAYLEKPVNKKTLLETVEELLHQ